MNVCSLILDLLNGAVLIVEQALHLQRTQMGDVVRGYTVVVEQEPLALVLDDAVVGSPAHDGVEEHALIGERAVGVVADGVAEEVAVASGVAEIVFAVVLVHPRCLEETMGIAGLQGLTVFVDDDHIVRSLCKLHHIITQTDHAAGQGRHVGRSEELCLLVSGRTQVDAFLQELLG